MSPLVSLLHLKRSDLEGEIRGISINVLFTLKAEEMRRDLLKECPSQRKGPKAGDVLDIRPKRIYLHEMAYVGLTDEVEDHLLSYEFILLYEATFVLAPGNEAMEINQTRHILFQTNGGG